MQTQVTDTLDPKVLNAFKKNQKAPSSVEVSWGASEWVAGAKKQRFYCLLEYDLYLTHLYNDKAEWLYTLKEATNYADSLNQNTNLSPFADAAILKLVHKYKDLSKGNFDRNPPYRTSTLQSANGKSYYLVDIDLPVKKGSFSYTPLSNAKELGGSVLRILVDSQFKVLQEFMLYGDDSELYELYHMAPIFIP